MESTSSVVCKVRVFLLKVMLLPRSESAVLIVRNRGTIDFIASFS